MQHKEEEIVKDIVISGAGPIGLYLAMRLKQIINKYHLKVNITVVDQRAGKYSRPGVIANEALKLLEEGLQVRIDDVEKPTPNSMFIQDLETSLFNKAEKMGIKFVKSNFKSFTTNKMILEDAYKKTNEISCDLAVDCTGQARWLVRKMNEVRQGEAFQITSIGDNPIKNHFVAYIKMDKENAALSGNDNKDPLKRALALEELRKLGWTEFSEPTVDTGKWVDKQNANIVNAYYYFEMPESLEKGTKEQHVAWL